MGPIIRIEQQICSQIGFFIKIAMSNDFLRSYTIPTKEYSMIPTVQKHETESSKASETNTESILEETPGISKYNRYVSPGKQGNQVFIANAMKMNPLKRPFNNASSKVCSEDSEIRLPIFTGRDRSYPDELNVLINPLHCELCNVKLNSQKTAACHYESKQHDRKITSWLAERYPENPPVVKRFAKDGPTGPEALRCDICDLPLTSLAHAKQHYAGRKHRLVASKKTDPSGAGYYDAEGKWVRTGTKKFGAKVSDIRFGIGEDFVPAPIPEVNENGKESTTVVSPKPVDESLCCKICNIVVTSSTQMTMHISGTKHKKKAATGEVNENPVLPQTNNVTNANSILASINEDTKDFQEFSMYRTPTGSYYCQICNTSMNNVCVLQQHIQGKKHRIKMKSNQIKPESSPAQ